MKIFIVAGETGKYDDWCQWTVKAFFSEEKAREFSEKAKNRADELKRKYGLSAIPAGASDLDPYLTIIDSVIQYSYFPVEIGDELPTKPDASNS